MTTNRNYRNSRRQYDRSLLHQRDNRGSRDQSALHNLLSGILLKTLRMSSGELNVVTVDKITRRKFTCGKILETIWVTWALLFVGISDCLLGPSLLDLQALLQTDLTKLNYVVLATGLADFVGAIMAGFLAKTADINLRLCVCMFIGSLSVALCAEVPVYAYVLTMFSIHGFIRGMTFCYAIEKTNCIWSRNKGTAFQAITFGPTIAGVMSTLIIRMFLCEAPLPDQNVQSIDQLYLNDSNLVTSVTHLYTQRNISAGLMNNTSEEMIAQCKQSEVRISLAYNILGGFNLPLSIIYLLYWWTDGRSREGRTEVRTVEEEEETEPSSGREEGTLAFSVFFVIFYFFLYGGHMMYSTYLTEIGVNGPLHVAKPTMVYMTSAFWASSLLGRILGIFIAAILGMEKLIIGYLVLLLLFLTVLVFTMAHSQLMFWIATCGIGVFIDVYTGAGYGWCAGVATLNPRVISASGASLGLGGMVLPFLGGMILKSFGALPFLYFFYAIFICTALVFVMLVVLSR